jgi:hypothetical protein
MQHRFLIYDVKGSAPSVADPSGCKRAIELAAALVRVFFAG